MFKSNEICCESSFNNQRSTMKNDDGIINEDLSRSKMVEIMRPAPFWSGVAIKDSKIVNISLNDYRGKYLVFLFYPHDFTIVCPTELLQFSDRVDEFTALDCKIVAVSTDSEYVHLAWSTTPRKQGGLGEMKLPMLSDKSHEIAKSYGVYDSARGIAYRGLFVIDDKSILRHITINDTAIPRSVDEVLRVIEASKFVDKNGDVCPMGPKDDESTDEFTEKSTLEEYFSTDLIKNTLC